MAPPNLSSYILSETLSHELFKTAILPDEFPPTTTPSSSRPLAVLLLGQTGAGKTRTAPTLQAQLSTRRQPPIHLIADTYKAFHPSYASLSSSNPALVSAATGPDARRWLAMAVDEAVSRRVDVLLESACRHPSDFISLAEKFREGGYRVEVVVLAVPEGLSRLGIMTRYYQRLPEAGSRGLPIRLTPKKVHDDSYAGLLASAEWLDGGGVDQVLVVRRRRVVVFGSENVEGRLRGSVAQVVRSERRRPLSEEEARTAREDMARLEGVEAAGADLEEVEALLKPLLDGGPQAGKFPPLQPLLFPDPEDPTRRSDNTLRLGG